MDRTQVWQDFLTAIKICIGKYLISDGRASRPEFWYFFLLTTLVSALFNSQSSGIGGLISLILFLPSLMVAIRRLHDVGKSGWWMLFIFLPVIGFFMLVMQFIKQGDVGDNEFGPEPDDISSFRPETSDRSTNFGSQYEPSEDEVAQADEDDIRPAKDRYGRAIDDDKGKVKKNSDFLEG